MRESAFPMVACQFSGSCKQHIQKTGDSNNAQ